MTTVSESDMPPSMILCVSISLRLQALTDAYGNRKSSGGNTGQCRSW